MTSESVTLIAPAGYDEADSLQWHFGAQSALEDLATTTSRRVGPATLLPAEDGQAYCAGYRAQWLASAS